MADNILDTLLVQFAFDNQKLNQSTRQVSDTVDGLVKNISQKFATLATTIEAVFALDIAKNLIEGFAQAGTQVLYLSQRIQENVESIGAWDQATKRFGGTAEATNNTLKSLYDRITNFKYKGDPQFAMGLNQLGVSAVDSHGHLKQTSQLLLDIGQSLKNAPQDKKNFFAQMFGIDDATMRFITQGRTQAEAYLKQMEKQGVITEKQAEKSRELANRLADLDQKWDMIKVTLGEKLMPVAIKFVDKILMPLVNNIPKLIKDFTDLAHSMGLSSNALAKIGVGLGVFLVVAPILGIISTGISAIGVAAGIALGPIGALASAIGVVIAGYKLITHYNDPAQRKELAKDVQSNFFIDKLNSVTKYASNALNKAGLSYLGGKSAGLWDDAISWAQARYESSGNPNAQVVDTNGKLSTGLYQIQLATAQQYRPGTTYQDLKNPVINKQIRDMIFADGLSRGKKAIASGQAVGSDPKLAALALFNGGTGDFNFWKRTGHTINNYGENIENSALRSQALNTSHNTVNHSNTTHNTTVSIDKVHLPGVSDSKGFINQFNNGFNPWDFSNSYGA